MTKLAPPKGQRSRRGEVTYAIAVARHPPHGRRLRSGLHRLEWTRNDSWGFTVTVASVVIPIFLVLIWLAVYVMWGIAREGLRGTGPGHPSPPGPGGTP